MQAERKEMYAKLTYLTRKIKKNQDQCLNVISLQKLYYFPIQPFFGIVEKNKSSH